VSAHFLLYWLISEQFASFTIEHEGRTVLPKINQIGLNRTPFPMAKAQQETACQIRKAFSWIDKIANEHEGGSRLIDRLDQSILAKAFRGELVPQDPNDEPASVLLKRIRAERGKRPKEKGGRARSLVIES
jgi:type I restriction enzyme S subunit